MDLIKLRSSQTATNVPPSLELGEVGINEVDGILYYRDYATGNPVALIWSGGKFTGAIQIDAGSGTAPNILAGLAVENDPDTGLAQLGGANTFSIVTNGTERLRVDSSGRVFAWATSSADGFTSYIDAPAATGRALAIRGRASDNLSALWFTTSATGLMSRLISTTTAFTINGPTGGEIRLANYSGTTILSTTDSGNVGIGLGNAAPTSRLHVNGNVAFESSSGVPLTVTNTGTGNSFVVNDAGGVVAGVDTTPFVIAAGGQVGIGTSTPAAPLNVMSASTSNLSPTQRWAYALNNDTFNLQLRTGVTSGVVRWCFDQTNNSTAYSNVLCIDRGKVGIGTADPASALHVSGVITVATTSGSGPSSYLPSVSFASDPNTGLGSLAADSVSLFTNGTEQVRVDAGGRVGINAVPTNRRLTVRGSLAYDGSVLLQSSSTGTNGSRGFLIQCYGTNSDAYIWNFEDSPIIFGVNGSEKMRLRQDGNLAIGGGGLAASQLSVQSPMTGGTAVNAIYSGQTVQSDVTAAASVFRSFVGTAAASFTLPLLVHFNASANTFGAGSTVTEQAGFLAQSNLTGATNNYGFRGSIADATGRWNVYMDGTAPNYFAGKVGIGTSPASVFHVSTPVETRTRVAEFTGTSWGGGEILDIGFTRGATTVAAVGCDLSDSATTASLIFDTGGVERMRIAATGNVGVGEGFVPAERLHVFGNALLEGNTRAALNIKGNFAGSTDVANINFRNAANITAARFVVDSDGTDTASGQIRMFTAIDGTSDERARINRDGRFFVWGAKAVQNPRVSDCGLVASDALTVYPSYDVNGAAERAVYNIASCRTYSINGLDIGLVLLKFYWWTGTRIKWKLRGSAFNGADHNWEVSFQTYNATGWTGSDESVIASGKCPFSQIRILQDANSATTREYYLALGTTTTQWRRDCINVDADIGWTGAASLDWSKLEWSMVTDETGYSVAFAQSATVEPGRIYGSLLCDTGSGSNGTYLAGMAFRDDPNTGIMQTSSGADTVSLVAGGNERVRVDTGLRVLQPEAGTSVGRISLLSPDGGSIAAENILYGDSYTSGTLMDIGARGFVVYGASRPLGLCTTGSNGILIGTNGTERMRIDSSGQVGIGTSAADGSLVVAAGTQGTPSTGGYIGLTTGTNSSKIRGAAIDTFTTAGGNNHGLRFYTNASATTPDVRMLIDSNGNVGIGTGTAVPASRLEVNGVITVAATAGSSGSYLPSLCFSSDPNTGVGSLGADQVSLFTNGFERLRINNTGNVGIGNTPASNVSFFVRSTVDTNTTSTRYCVLVQPTIGAQSTSAYLNHTSSPIFAANATTSTCVDYHASNPTLGSGAAITNCYGFFCVNLDKGTNNYGFHGNLTASGFTKYNFYASGDAPNYFSGNVGIGVTQPNAKLHVAGETKLIGPITEGYVDGGNSGTAKTIALTNGTVQNFTLTGTCNFTMPTAVAGQSFTVLIRTGLGGYSANFLSVKWPSTGTPATTQAANKLDIFTFVSDGTNWYGNAQQGYTP